MVRFLTFENIHGKKNTGSTYIRVHQLLKYWKEAEIYKYGEHPEVMIFQKVYWTPDYHFMENLDSIKILDICDPDWLDNAYVKRTIDNMDAVTCPTKELKEFLQQLTDKPVKIVPDRFDLENVPKLKVHKNKKDLKAVWFGYSHNAEVLKPAIQVLEKHNISLTVISNDDPFAWRWALKEDYKNKYKFIKYNEESIYERLQECDICILPHGNRPVDRFKSNNKTIKAFLAGLPVAKDIDQLEKYLDNNTRNIASKFNYEKAKEDYDVKKSIEEYKQLIETIKSNK